MSPLVSLVLGAEFRDQARQAARITSVPLNTTLDQTCSLIGTPEAEFDTERQFAHWLEQTGYLDVERPVRGPVLLYYTRHKVFALYFGDDRRLIEIAPGEMIRRTFGFSSSPSEPITLRLRERKGDGWWTGLPSLFSPCSRASPRFAPERST
jgi:hypothetical protein